MLGRPTDAVYTILRPWTALMWPWTEEARHASRFLGKDWSGVEKFISCPGPGDNRGFGSLGFDGQTGPVIYIPFGEKRVERLYMDLRRMPRPGSRSKVSGCWLRCPVSADKI